MIVLSGCVQIIQKQCTMISILKSSTRIVFRSNADDIFRSYIVWSKPNKHSRFSTCSGVNEWDASLSQTKKRKIEEYWRDKINFTEYQPNSENPKCYILSMFPYPSGNLHMGHVRVYSISDTLARFHRLNGKNVLHPMGWDAFGLPAENAAIERGLSSETWTENNIRTMKKQLIQLGCTFDWSREIATCHANYYKFTQAIFLKMFEQGLVYQKKALVNWDPVDCTVLADEQVDSEGCSWRSGVKVEKRVLRQWFIRTTAFAESLYNGLFRKDLEDWRDIVDLQKQWIGVCDGVRFEFPLENQEGELSFWMENPQDLSKARFVTVLPGSVLDIEGAGEGVRKLDTSVKSLLTGELLPVFVTSELPVHEGSDGRICIPEVNECDLKFANKNGFTYQPTNVTTKQMSKQGVINKINGRVSSANLRDWLISRQRHWGTPIPMIHCDKCGVQPVPLKQLPVTVPPVNKVAEKGNNKSEDWLSISCPKCGGEAKRDQDTMDTFVDSSWYYLRFLDPHNKDEPFSKTIAKNLMPVDIYIGGKEHAVLHLYYARFVSYFLHSLGWLPDPEPFKRLVVQGMVMGKTYRTKGSGKYIPASKVDTSGSKPVEKETNLPVIESWEKMSKSKYNGVDPAEMFETYGLDTTRLLIMSAVAPTSQRNWDDSTFPGVLNWQYKLWLTIYEFRNARLKADILPAPANLDEVNKSLRDSRNYYLQGITVSYLVTHQFNQVIARMQGLTGDLRRQGADYKAHSVEYERALAMQIVALCPLAPHFAAELWTGLQSLPRLLTTQEFDWGKQAHQQTWPEIDNDYSLNLTCSVNTATKDNLKVLRMELDRLTVSSATELALTSPEVQAYTDQTPVTDAQFRLYPGLQASINLTVDHTQLHFDKDHYSKKNKAKKKKSLR